MRARIQTLFGMAMLLVLAGLFVWGFVEAVQAAAPVVGAVGAAALGAAGVVWQQRKSEKARLREAHRDRMTPTYNELLKVVWEQVGTGKQPTEELEAFMRDLKARQLVLGASREMIESFLRWETEAAAAQEKNDNIALVFAWEELLRAMRRDLGHDDSGMARGELLRVFMTDLDTFLPQLEAKAAAEASSASETPPKNEADKSA